MTCRIELTSRFIKSLVLVLFFSLTSLIWEQGGNIAFSQEPDDTPEKKQPQTQTQSQPQTKPQTAPKEPEFAFQPLTF